MYLQSKTKEAAAHVGLLQVLATFSLSYPSMTIGRLTYQNNGLYNAHMAEDAGAVLIGQYLVILYGVNVH